MGRYLLRRLCFALLLIFVVSSASLLLTHLAPGDATTVDPVLSDKEREEMRRRLGLDRPFAAQYASWVAGALTFDFGESSHFKRPVSELLGERAINTMILASIALLLATLVGVPLGVYVGGGTGGLARALVRGASVLALSVPPLIGSLVLVVIAARTGWVPVGGMTSFSASELTWAQWVADIARHLPVPALALAIPLAAMIERLQAQSLMTSRREPFVAASRARGLSESAATLRHAWPAALRPLLGLYGVMIGTLFSGSFVVEVVTSWPGLGQLMFDALKSRDLYLVTGCAATGAFFLAAGTLIADTLLAIADPRVGASNAS